MIKKDDFREEKKETKKKKKKHFRLFFLILAFFLFLVSIGLELSITTAKMIVPEKVIDFSHNEDSSLVREVLSTDTIKQIKLINYDSISKILLVVSFIFLILMIIFYILRRKNEKNI